MKCQTLSLFILGFASFPNISQGFNFEGRYECQRRDFDEERVNYDLVVYHDLIRNLPFQTILSLTGIGRPVAESFINFYGRCATFSWDGSGISFPCVFPISNNPFANDLYPPDDVRVMVSISSNGQELSYTSVRFIAGVGESWTASAQCVKRASLDSDSEPDQVLGMKRRGSTPVLEPIANLEEGLPGHKVMLSCLEDCF